jgi:hypothetical protein
MASSRDFFNQAEACIENEEIAKAKGLIEQAIALVPTSVDILYIAVHTLKYAELYSSARKEVENYQRLTGMKLPLEYPYYEGIVELERKNAMMDDVPVFDLAAGPLRFVRVRDNGYFSSLVPVWKPVEEIEVSEEGIIVTESKIKYRYAWNEITRASIAVRIVEKDRWGYKGSQKICTLDAPGGKRFQFDLSSTLPDFEEALLIRTILNKYLDVEFIDERKPGFKAAKDNPIRYLTLKRWIRDLIAGGGLILIVYLYAYMLSNKN